MFCKNLIKFTVKHLYWSFFVGGLQLYKKKRLQHRCFPVDFSRFWRIPTEHLRWLLLQVSLLISCKIYLIIMFSCKQKSSKLHKLSNEVVWYVLKNVNSIIPVCLLVFYHLCQSLLILLLPFINSAISNVISNYFYSSLHFTQIFLSK